MIDFKFNNLTEKVVKQMVKIQLFANFYVLKETLSRFWAQNNENGYQKPLFYYPLKSRSLTPQMTLWYPKYKKWVVWIYSPYL